LRKALLPYGVSTLDPVIEITDTSLVKGKIKLNVEKRIVARLAELEREYNLMVDLFNINKTVLKSEFSFEPKQNQIYHLYERENGTTFLSLIEPQAWGFYNPYHLVSVRLSSDGIWEDINHAIQ